MLASLVLAAHFVAASPPQGSADSIQAICARSNGLAKTEEIGRTRQDRPIPVITIARGDDLDARPGVLIVAGADGRRAIDTELALHHCAKLVDDFAAGDEATQTALETSVFYVIPQLNPDGAALGRHGNAMPLDLDRDGATDEDGPDDLNGDGVVTWMRWPADDGKWLIDPDQPELMREAKREDRERGTHQYELESRDRDGDDERTEDDGQGVWIDRTLPHLWDEFDRRTGSFPSSEPETRAIADFVYAHRNIVVAFVWGRDDNLLKTPKVVKPKARVQNTGILEDDKALFERAGEAYREATGRKGDSDPRMDGSPWAWLYLQIGVPTFASDVWRSPALEEEKKDDPLKLHKRRLAASRAAERGFSEWRTFDHPELGEVEIGGFTDEDETTLLAADARPEVFDVHHAFVLDVVSWRSRCEITSFEKKQLAPDTFEVTATIINEGDLPAVTATGTRSRRFSRPRVVLDPGTAAIVAGNPRQRLRNLEPHGGRQELRWIVSGSSGTRVSLNLRCDPVDSDVAEVVL